MKVSSTLLIIIILTIIMLASATKPLTSSASSSSLANNFRLVTVNSLFEDFYVKYSSTATKYPRNQRNRAVEAGLLQEPLLTADAICWQEFDMNYIPFLREGGFLTYLSFNPRAGRDPRGSAYVAISLRMQTMIPVDVVSTSLEAGSKAIVFASAIHRSTGALLLIGSAHVPWSRNQNDYVKYFRTMIDVMSEYKRKVNTTNQQEQNVAAIIAGDFNCIVPWFTNALTKDEEEKTLVKNAIPDVTFTSLSPSNTGLVIDHMWYLESNYLKRKTTMKSTTAKNDDNENEMTNEDKGNNDDEASSSSPSTEELQIITPTVVVPSTAGEMMRHKTCPNGGKDYDAYYSDHATIGADFEINSTAFGLGSFPSKNELFNIVSAAANANLGPVADTKQLF